MKDIIRLIPDIKADQGIKTTSTKSTDWYRYVLLLAIVSGTNVKKASNKVEGKTMIISSPIIMI